MLADKPFRYGDHLNKIDGVLFMRRFPVWGMDFPNFYLNTPPHGEEVKKRVIELIQQDKTHLDFPQANLDCLLQAWDELGGPEL